MFCQKCGYKLIEGAIKCSNCGADASATQVCGGFWGLVSNDANIPAPQSPPPQPIPITRPIAHNTQPEMNRSDKMSPVNTPQKDGKLFKVLTIVSLTISIITLAISVILFLKIHSLEKEITPLSQTINDLSYKIHDTESENESNSEIENESEDAVDEITDDEIKISETETDTSEPTPIDTETIEE